MPTVSVTAMTAGLAAFAADEGIGATHRAVLVFNGAGWHTSGHLVLSTALDLVFLPAASPELQPAERLWSLVDEPMANRAFADLAAIEDVIADRCCTLVAGPHMLRTHTRLHWWPDELRPALVITD